MRDVSVFVDEISAKFGYSETLTNDLKRIIPIMLEGKDDEKGKMLFDMLSETKIFVLPYDAGIEDLEECKKEIFGNDNDGVTFIDADQGEYGKLELSGGAYISEPVFDEDMNIIRRNRMLFVKELAKGDSLREMYGSNINLSHLIHELGHAWAAEKDEYIQNEDGSFVQNVGAASITHSIDKRTKEVKGLETEGLFIEESLDTIQEEQTLFKLIGAKSIDELKEKGYVSSSYQGMLKSIMESYVDKFGIEVFEEYRFSKDQAVLADIELALAETDAWTTLGTDEYTQAKRKSISSVDGLDVPEESKSKIKQFFEHYDAVYFADNTKFTPIQKLNNVLEQLYDFSSVKYNFNILGNENNLAIYKRVVSAMVAEGNALRNEARDVEKTAIQKQDMMSHLRKEIQGDESVASYYMSTTDTHDKVSIEQEGKENR